MRRFAFLIFLVVASLVLGACAEESTASTVVESYLKAKISGDENKLVSLSCKSWEAQAALDAAPFKSVKAELKDLACRENGTDGSATLVICDGTLIIQYRGEDPREQSLAETQYRAVKEDGEWKLCGEQ